MFLLVNWINDRPKTWSVVPINLLADGKLRKSKNLVGTTMGITWRRSIQEALVLEAGSNQSDLDAKADVLAELELTKAENIVESNIRTGRKRTFANILNQPSSSKQNLKVNNSTNPSKRLSRAAEIDSVLENIDPSNSSDQGIQDQPLQLQCQQSGEEQVAASFKDDLEALQNKYKILRRKYKDLKKEHKLCSSDEAVELLEGSGIKLDRSEVSALQTMSASMTIFARNLFRRVFSPEDISGHSLTGRRSTSLQNHVPLPSVDHVKRDAVIEFCLKTYGYEISASSSKKFLRKRKSAKTSIIKSLSDYIREENSKMKAS